MERKRPGALARIDQEALAVFRQDLRRRYTDEQIVAELRDCAVRLGRSPTMRQIELNGRRGWCPGALRRAPTCFVCSGSSETSSAERRR